MSASDDVAALLSLLDGLKERGLLARAHVVKAGDAVVQLGGEAPVLGAEDPRDRSKREAAEADDLIYGAA